MYPKFVWVEKETNIRDIHQPTLWCPGNAHLFWIENKPSTSSLPKVGLLFARAMVEYYASIIPRGVLRFQGIYHFVLINELLKNKEVRELHLVQQIP